MKRRSSLAFILSLSLFINALAQDTKPSSTPSPAQPQQEDEEVVRITTNLVQIDAVITDKNGKLVTDLRPEELEILEDGRPQKITNFSFVSTESGAAQPQPAASAPNVDKTAPPPPPVRLKPEQVRRTVALVVDDLGLSFESTYFVRRALKKFVDEQLQPGDLVAIVRTAGGMGALQQFTSDKRQLYAAIERVKWNPQGRGGVGAFMPFETNPAERASEDMANKGVETIRPEAEGIDQFREDVFSVGTLGAVNYVVRGMRELPGRKSILLMSDGIRIFNRDDASRSTRVLDSLRRLTDLANRASVVIYTMDARGLQTLNLAASDNVTGMEREDIEDKLAQRRDDFFESQAGLDYLARQTGGFPIRNNNDLSAGIKRVLEDQKGYYLIGYRPDESTFDPKTGRRQFHKITLKLKRPGLKHRTRTGFYGITDEEASPQQRPTRSQQLIGALTSPFGSGGVKIRLTSLYGNDPKVGGFLRSLMHIEARDLTFTDEPDDWHKTVFDVLAVTFGDNGTVVDEIARTQTMRLRGETYKRSLENGLVFIVTVPVKKPGAYQLRAALRDTATERVGSASQFIDVPNLGKNRLTLSGIILNGTDPSAKPATAPNKDAATPANATAPNAQAKNEEANEDPQAGPAVRRFSRGMVMSYAYVVYNATLDKATGRPRIQTQIRVFRDGKEVFTGRVQQFDASDQPDLKRLMAGAALQLGADMKPGEYILQVIVTDPLASEKHRMATQWIDFEIIK